MLIPTVVENDGSGQRAYDIYSLLLKQDIIMLSGGIDTQVASVIVAQLLFLQSVNPKKQVNLYLNSGGGSITDGLSIVNTMEMITNPVSVVCMGQACSMGAVILACGEPGLRLSLPDSSIMIHQPSSGFKGTFVDQEIHVNETKRLRDLIYKKLAGRMSKTPKQVEKMCDRDNWMSPKDALENGIIDKVLS
jgi:ATP-dependent Clp protease protease subunit